MSTLHIEGAINRNTAAILALAFTVELSEGVGHGDARNNVQQRFDMFRDYVVNE